MTTLNANRSSTFHLELIDCAVCDFSKNVPTVEQVCRDAWAVSVSYACSPTRWRT